MIVFSFIIYTLIFKHLKYFNGNDYNYFVKISSLVLALGDLELIVLLHNIDVKLYFVGYFCSEIGAI